jgi:hypothetical protein
LSAPDCRDDFLNWRPLSYREHFEASNFKGRALAIAAYDDADPRLRQNLDALAATMTVVLEATRAAMKRDLRQHTAIALAENATTALRPLVARAGAVINGEADAGATLSPQAVVDRLMKRG